MRPAHVAECPVAAVGVFVAVGALLVVAVLTLVVDTLHLLRVVELLE